MAVVFARLSFWLWGTKKHESINSALNSSSDFPSGFREPDSVKFSAVNRTEMRSSSKRSKGKWKSREERRMVIDRECDMVIVPSDGESLSDSESDGSDWSIGWMEPHSQGFLNDEGDTENSFSVLVPCYGRGPYEKRERLKRQSLGVVTEHYGFSSERADFIEKWLSSLRDM